MENESVIKNQLNMGNLAATADTAEACKDGSHADNTNNSNKESVKGTETALSARDTVYAAYREYCEVDIPTQDRKNRAALFNRLANLEGPLSGEMRALLTAKLKAATESPSPALKEIQQILGTPLTLLTPEEAEIFIKLFKTKWLLRLDTGIRNKDIKIGHDGCLLAKDVENKAYHDADDAVEDPSPLFEQRLRLRFELDEEDRKFWDTQTILAEYHGLSVRKGNPLVGLWMDEYHLIEKCRKREQSDIMCFLGVEYCIRYHTTADHATPAISSSTANTATTSVIVPDKTDRKEIAELAEPRYVKTRHFRLPNGKMIKQTEALDDCIFMQPHLEGILILRAIEILRWLEKEIWEQFTLKDKDDIKTWQDLLNLFSLDNMDSIYIPKFFPMTQPEVRVLLPEENRDLTYRAADRLLVPIIELALRGDTVQVNNRLDAKVFTGYNISYTWKYQLNLVSAAVYSLREDLFASLMMRLSHSKQYRGINDGVLRSRILSDIFSLTSPGFEKEYEDSIKALASPTEAKDKDANSSWEVACSKQSRDPQIKSSIFPDLRKRTEWLINALEIYCEYFSRYRGNPKIHLSLPLDTIIEKILLRRDFSIMSGKILFHFQHYLSSPQNRFPVFLAVYLRSPWLVAQLIKMGRDINRPFYQFYNLELDLRETLRKNIPYFSPGMTPLMLAIVLKEGESIRILLSHDNIKLDATLISSESTLGGINAQHAYWVSEYEGYTALMFAIEISRGEESIVRQLLAAKPRQNIFHYAANGRNALTLSEKLGFPNIVKILRDYAETHQLQPTPMSRVVEETAGYPYKIFSHIRTLCIVIRGKTHDNLYRLKISEDALHSFYCVMAEHFSIEKLLEHFNDSFPNIGFNANDFSLLKLGAIHFGIKESECHHLDEFYLFEIKNRKKRQEIIKQMGGEEPSSTVVKKETVSKEEIPPGNTTLNEALESTVFSIDASGRVSEEEWKALSDCYKKCVEDQTILIGCVQSNDKKGVSELLARIPKRDLNITVPLAKKKNLTDLRPEYHNALGVARDQFSQSHGENLVIKAEIIQMLIQAGACCTPDFKLHEMLRVKLELERHSIAVFGAADFEDLLARKEYAELSRNEFEATLRVILYYDHLDIFNIYRGKDVLSEYYRSNNKDDKRRSFKRGVLSLAYKIVTSLAKELDQDTIEDALLSFIKHYSSNNREDLGQKHVEEKIKEMLELLLRLCKMDADRLKQKIKFQLFSSPSFLRLILSFCNLDQDKDRDFLESLLDTHWCHFHANLEVLEYLLKQYSLNQKVDELIVRRGADQLINSDINIKAIRILLPFASQRAIKETWKKVIECYSGPDVNTGPARMDEILQMFSRVSDGGALFFSQFLAVEINQALQTAFCRQDLALFNGIQRLTKIQKEDEACYSFASNTQVNGKNVNFITSLLNSLLDPRGRWTLFIPILQQLSLRTENKGFLEYYFREYHAKAAIELASIEDKIKKNDDKSLSEFLRIGGDPNANLFIISSGTIKRFSLMEIAMQHRAFRCMSLLLVQGVIVYNEGHSFNVLSGEVLDQMVSDNEHGILTLLLKNNNDLELIWHRLKFYRTRISGCYGGKSMIAMCFDRLLKQVSDFSESVQEYNYQALSRHIRGMPQSMLIECLENLVRKFIEKRPNRFLYRNKFVGAAEVKLSIVKIIELLLTNIKEIKIEKSHLLFDVLTLIRNCKDPLMPEYLAGITNTPVLRKHVFWLCLDSIYHLDFRQLKLLQDRYGVNILFNDPISMKQWQGFGLAVSLIEEWLNSSAMPHFNITPEKNLLSLFLFVCIIPEQFFQGREQLAADFFKKLLQGSNSDKLFPQVSFLKFIIQNCQNEGLKKKISDLLRVLPEKIQKNEKNWAAVSVLFSFIRANPVHPLRYSILPVLKKPEEGTGILAFAGLARQLQKSRIATETDVSMGSSRNK